MRNKILIIILVLICSLKIFSQESKGLEIEVGIPVLIPLGDYAKLTSFAYGISSQVHIVPQAIQNISGFADIQVLGNLTKVDSTSLTNLGLGVGVEYKFPNIGPKKLSLTAQAAMGMYIHIASGEWNEGTSGTNVFTDQYISLAPGIHWQLTNNGEALLRLKYTTFLESEDAGHLLGAVIGYRIKL